MIPHPLGAERRVAGPDGQGGGQGLGDVAKGQERLRRRVNEIIRLGRKRAGVDRLGERV